jgi:hypothetical protein
LCCIAQCHRRGRPTTLGHAGTAELRGDSEHDIITSTADNSSSSGSSACSIRLMASYHSSTNLRTKTRTGSAAQPLLRRAGTTLAPVQTRVRRRQAIRGNSDGHQPP